MKRHKKIFYLAGFSLLIGFLMIFMVSGCATAPEKNVALENARAAYEQAQADPEISSYAPVAMHEASIAMKKAEEARKVEEMEHLAYLAEIKTKIAREQAAQKKAEREVERLSREKDSIVLQAREFETKRAISLAETREREAERARMEAEAKAREVERARGEAQALALQAEKARQEAEARAVDIERARSETEAKALEAEQARKVAEAKALELEQARKEAEAKALEAEMARVKTEEALAQKKQLETELAELKAEQTERGAVLTLGDILFEVNKDRLMPGAMLTMDKLAAFLKKYSKRNVLVEGHTDSTGSATYNLGLSQRRADSARNALLERGITADRIVTKGYGEEFPVASNATPAGRQQNRRVEIIILEEGVSPEKMLR